MSLDLTGAEGSREFIEAAAPEHPSLLDPTHRMSALFGVVNIPNVIWIDEAGLIVRPAEPGWPAEANDRPKPRLADLPTVGRARRAPEPIDAARDTRAPIDTGQARASYHEAIRDWAAHGPDSPYALSPDAVVARSQLRTHAMSEGAAHFELANHLWRSGERTRSIVHFNEANRLQPDNWAYKRQAWSLVARERVGDRNGFFVQGPLEGEEDSWPFDSDFWSDVAALPEGGYYPKTLEAASNIATVARQARRVAD